MLNRIIIMGRLTRDPELRRTQTGLPVASFTLAVDRDFKDKTTGEKGVDFIDVVAWRSTAEYVSRYFTKGRMAVAEGRLQMRDWTDKDGNKRRTAEVVAENVYFGDSKRDGDGGSYAGSAGASGGYSNNNYPSNQYASQNSYNAPVSGPENSGYGSSSSFGNDQYSDMSDIDGDLPF